MMEHIKVTGVNCSYFNKVVDTLNKVGLPPHLIDDVKVIEYTALSDYYKQLEEAYKMEPKHENNPNYRLMLEVKKSLDKLDQDLKIHFYPKAAR